VAPDLLGSRIRHAGVTVRLTEVEAYDGMNDPGSHAYRGPTPRTTVMFGPPGHLYVYFSYGMHWCCNLVCGEAGRASAVLLRAGEVVAGLDLARERRGGMRDRDLARGPARLAQALGLTGAQNGADVTSSGGEVRVCRPLATEPTAGLVRSGPRVGVSGAGGDGTAYPWRFWLEGEATVSAYRPGGARKRRRTKPVAGREGA
ncbi:MAG TPA: DNA-3-methyladenine glycosylase, partial [Segeticoccus sp.]|uniref:DNA-3-methyladenine glycosylase n=1 Tax=Segeticoccus sp. TaxID=2706531 RepID=UPI002D7EE193